MPNIGLVRAIDPRDEPLRAAIFHQFFHQVFDNLALFGEMAFPPSPSRHPPATQRGGVYAASPYFPRR
jgi:hypothetical protein